VTKGIHHAFARENAVCGHEFFEQVVELGHRRFPLLWLDVIAPRRRAIK
jgi:hypothetical protein